LLRRGLLCFAPEMVELDLTARAKGMPIETPAGRP
jgi:hypothetical protein